MFGRHGNRRLSLAFDTAASHTHISSDIIDELGYSAAQGEAITSVRSAVGKESGYTLRVQRFESLGFGFDDFLIHVHDLLDDAIADLAHNLYRLKREFEELDRKAMSVPKSGVATAADGRRIQKPEL